jgi:Domain of unknown function (DUF4136)
MKSSIVALLGALAIACGGTTVQSAQVRTIESPAASFGQYRTFSLGLTEAPPSGYQLSSRSLDVEQRVRPWIVTALEQKGYVSSHEGERADLTVRFASATREAAVRTVTRNPDNHDVALEGALVVDVFDTATGVEVWHGSARAALERGRIDDELLERGVRELIARFPDHALGAAAGASRTRIVE